MLIEVKESGDKLSRGDIMYAKRELLLVERVGKPRKSTGKFSIRFRRIGRVNLGRFRRHQGFYGPELPAKLENAMALLQRTAEACCDNPPDAHWFRDFFLLTGIIT